MGRGDGKTAAVSEGTHQSCGFLRLHCGREWAGERAREERMFSCGGKGVGLWVGLMKRVSVGSIT